MKVKIIGAGSIGNHLAQASRRMGWEVCVVDVSAAALERKQKDIYPTRYGAWDSAIKLYLAGNEPKCGFDIIAIGTPPDSHVMLALEALKEKPRLLHIEKPLCEPNLKNIEKLQRAARSSDVMVTVGYDHAVSESIQAVVDVLKRRTIGDILTVDVEFREHWSGIF